MVAASGGFRCLDDNYNENEAEARRISVPALDTTGTAI